MSTEWVFNSNILSTYLLETLVFMEPRTQTIQKLWLVLLRDLKLKEETFTPYFLAQQNS